MHFPGQAAPGSSACLLNTSHAQGTGLGPTYPSGMADILPRAHGNFKGPRKCFSFHFVWNQKKRNNSDKHTTMNPAWITFVKCNVNYICQSTCKINFFLWKKVPMKTKVSRDCGSHNAALCRVLGPGSCWPLCSPALPRAQRVLVGTEARNVYYTPSVRCSGK